MMVLLFLIVRMGMIVAVIMHVMVFVVVVRMVVMVMLVVMVVRMGMVVVVVMIAFFLIQEHIKFASVDTGFIHPAKVEAVARHAQTGKSGLQNRAIRTQIQQGSHSHIPGNAGGAFEI
jgi:hypothetical protein